MALQPHEVTAAVAGCAIVANVVIAWVGLRHARTRAHNDRLWLRRAETYEGYTNYLVLQQKKRHESMTAPPEKWFEVHPPDPEEMFPVFNRMVIYGSSPIRAVADRADKAETEWREAYARWHLTEVGSKESRDAERQARIKWETADAFSHLVIEAIKRELLTDRKLKGRWFKRLRYQPDTIDKYGHLPKPDQETLADGEASSI